ncbi:DUF1772 domain-containing protein [Bailinhaonella thermotolerans]|uniref:DUF1772 domain-containing protein n=1 Tax=Bailinhaonella thermotolerans TaxID=1070861 RepID=A0A3A4AZR2_9ACTN|nr:anthrone oxygenase family protein [Bailinhaonella thermotolerans]RJL31323.1 DUF1772 domain-containing protein [Bailinhaonella thermotolerans]
MNALLFTLTLISALGSALVAGAFYAFSSFVMRGLTALPPERGLAAMQSINVTAVTPGFMAGFMGTTLLTAATAVTALVTGLEHGMAWLLAGCALYLVGVFVETAVVHVPRNNALAALDPSDPASAGAWARYASVWTAWNHVRTVAALAATACLVLALVAQP